MMVDLQPEKGPPLLGVSSERLAALHPFAPGHFVIGGGWVGRLESIRHDVRFAGIFTSGPKHLAIMMVGGSVVITDG